MVAELAALKTGRLLTQAQEFQKRPFIGTILVAELLTY
jgi:hypothetical protein